MIKELKQKAKYMLGPRIFLETEDFCYRSLIMTPERQYNHFFIN